VLEKKLKTFFVNLKHNTCIIHALHRCCEQFRNKNRELDYFISEIKKLLRKNATNQKVFIESAKLRIQKIPILTDGHLGLHLQQLYQKIIQNLAVF
jgi:hypothetical protein